jgi:parvulin-like peptidyl-prolyl isomerase
VNFTQIFFIVILFFTIVSADIVATINGKNIYSKDIDHFMKIQYPKSQYEILNKEQKLAVVNEYVNRELLLEKAKKAGIENDKEFKKVLQTAKDNLLLETWLKQEVDKVEVSNKEMLDFYIKNIEKFKTPKKIWARHILFSSEDKAIEVIRELRVVDKKLLKSKFIALAKAKSISSSASKGGDMGWFGFADMPLEFSQVAFKMAVGTMTPSVVQTDFGYHVIYLEDKKEAGFASFYESKNIIKDKLKIEKFKEKNENLNKKIRATLKIIVK